MKTFADVTLVITFLGSVAASIYGLWNLLVFAVGCFHTTNAHFHYASIVMWVASVFLLWAAWKFSDYMDKKPVTK